MLDKFINEAFTNILPTASKNVRLKVVQEILSDQHFRQIAENEYQSLTKMNVSLCAV
jgi:hypothetical protein